jgi:hypothetical protein
VVREARSPVAPTAQLAPVQMGTPPRAAIATAPEARPAPVAAVPVAAVPVAAIPVTAPAAIPAGVNAQPSPNSVRTPALVSSPVSPMPASPIAVQPASIGDDESWDSDSDTLGAPSSSGRVARKKQAASSPRTILLVIVAIGVIFVAGMAAFGATIYFVFFSKPTPSTPSRQERDPIRVDPAAGQKLGTFLQRAKANDRFQILSDISETDLYITQPGVILEPAPGKTIVWKCPAPQRPPPKGHEPKLLMIQAAERVQVRGFVFDGNNHADALIVLYSQCPGTKLEDLQLKNMQTHGIRLVNSEGAEKAPVEINRVRIETRAGQAAVFLDIKRHTRTLVPVIRHVVFRDCVFEGPGSRFQTLDAEFVDNRSVDLGPGNKLEIAP